MLNQGITVIGVIAALALGWGYAADRPRIVEDITAVDSRSARVVEDGRALEYAPCRSCATDTVALTPETRVSLAGREITVTALPHTPMTADIVYASRTRKALWVKLVLLDHDSD